MKTISLNTEEAPNKWWAAQDARMRNYANSTRYTSSQKLAAERMKLALEMVYYAKAVYISYGKTGVSLKVDHAVVKDSKELRLLEQGWAKAGVIKKITAQGITYRLTVA